LKEAIKTEKVKLTNEIDEAYDSLDAGIDSFIKDWSANIMACLTPLGIDKLKEMLSTNGTKLSQLARMETVARKAKITEAMGKENTDYINYEIEKRLISKTTKPLMNWVEREVTAPKQRADILKRVGKLVASIKDENSLKAIN